MKGFCHFPRISLQLRELTRYRKTQIDARVAEIQRLEIQDAGIKLTSVASKVMTQSEALTGHFGSHHAVACRRILAHLDFLDETIAALTEQIDARTTAFEAVYKSLLPVPGFDRLTIERDHRRDRRGHDQFPDRQRSRVLDRRVPWQL